jgi:hypothetical protein
MPKSCRRKATVGLKVQVKHGSMGILAAGVKEMNSHMGLEGEFVSGKSNIAINAKQRSPSRPSIGDKIGAQFVEVWREVGDEQECRFDYELLILGFILGEPLPIVVSLQPPQEVEKLWGEIHCLRHLNLLTSTRQFVGNEPRPCISRQTSMAS